MAKRKQSKPAARSRAPSKRQIEKIDGDLVALLNQRAELAQQRHLARHDTDEPADHDLLESIVRRNRGPLSAGALRAIFRELLGGIRAIATKTSVAFLGPEYTYSHLAAIEHFGDSAEKIPVGSIAAVFEEVELGQATFGIVPIENSTDGRVTDSLDCLASCSAKICAELPLRIRHCLLGHGPRGKVVRVVSKPQALSQCRNWLGKHLPNAERVEVASTTEAARRAAKEKGTAAIAAEQAGVHLGLDVLARHIEDNAENITRFAVIGKQSGPKTGSDKTAIVFEIDHQPGTLADAMAIFKRQKLNMTWIESFPLRGQRGRYVFFVEFQGHATELRARRALASLEKKAVRLTLLGSYAQVEPIG